MSFVTLSTCQLNQWALDFDGNLKRIQYSIEQAKEQGAKYRLGPELEVCGYGCEDHYLEMDTFQHCNESLAIILKGDWTNGILCDIGMPVLHNGVRYNCRVLCLDKKILLIRPKMCLADDGNYREGRYFSAWDSNKKELEDHVLPQILQDATQQTTCKLGIGAISTANTMIACETCEELWTPRSPHIDLFLGGVEIIGNGSGSHHQLRKLSYRIDLMISATAKCGGIYLYANQRGCDGSRLYFDGCSAIICNGKLYGVASQFSVKDVEVITATLNLDDVRSKRASIPSLGSQASRTSSISRINVPPELKFKLVNNVFDSEIFDASKLSNVITLIEHTPEEECSLGPACWLWDYLRRSGASGYLLPLSGGADSAATAAIVAVMCHLVYNAYREGDEQVIKDVKRICGHKDSHIFIITSPEEFCHYVFHSLYMGTDNSSAATENRATLLSRQIGGYHSNIKIDNAVTAVLGIFTRFTNARPKFLSQGGSMIEDLALQNIQARLRMVLAYLFAQLVPWVRSRSGFLLVLGSANVDEGLRGYMTKYDCSSADINPIGGINKKDLNNMLLHCAERYKYSALSDIAVAPPTAELRPTSKAEDGTEEHSQRDEDDMGMTYDELGAFGRLRKIQRCGPVSMFIELTTIWSHLNPTVIAAKVKRFFRFYSINRHKMTTITPSYHAENYGPDDNRFDLRQFLYNVAWTRQFNTIDNLLKKMSSTIGIFSGNNSNGKRKASELTSS